MASRSRAATTSQRPSTSSGSGNRFTEKPDFDKRISRDDLTLILKSTKKGTVRAYNSPSRDRRPSPDSGPRSASLGRKPLVRTTSPESLGVAGEMGVIAIGMALGSPSQAPGRAPAAWKPPRTITAAVEIPEPPESPELKAKSRKWGIFGRSKSKRGRAADKPFPPRSRTGISHAPHASVSSIAGRMEPDTRNPPKHKPIIIRSQTEPAAVERLNSGEPMPLQELSGQPFTKPSRQETSEQGSRTENSVSLPIPSTPQIIGPLLDVDIPNIKLDRYSVMFGNLLQPQPAASLLARRQATLDRLKTINHEIALEGGEELPRPRRATSPQPKSSPTFSLFPTPGGARPTITHRPSPRLRSNTSPAILHSPSKAKFSPESKLRKEPLKAKIAPEPRVHKEPLKTKISPEPKLHKEPLKVKMVTVSTTTTKDVKRDAKVTKPPPAPLALPGPRRHPPLVSRFSKQPSPFTPDKSSLILESPEITDDESKSQVKDKFRSAVTPPAGQMASQRISIASLSPKVPRKPTPPPSSTPPAKPPVTKPVITKPVETDAEVALRNAVALSIARQISVSHQQRKMLSNQNRRRKNNSAAANPLRKLSIGENERLAETKTATPRLVLPEDVEDSSDAILMRNRKSSLVILEGP
ncbi:hypothetical protein G7046_g2365 [Stylonectria norvegica]|nr:hypothetical protein G7046_g2365 [Stylonectria norvegica]